jgi:hypothetical protein
LQFCFRTRCFGSVAFAGPGLWKIPEDEITVDGGPGLWKIPRVIDLIRVDIIPIHLKSSEIIERHNAVISSSLTLFLCAERIL